MAYAIIKTGGKQYKVTDGSELKIEKLPKPENGKITFSEVLLVDDGKSVTVGKPLVAGAKVEADYVEEGKGKKVMVVHYKAKVRYKKTYGHRQPYTKIKVSKV